MRIRSRRLVGRAAAFIVAIGVLASANPARAIDIDLPGERQLQIHGFYEMRLRFHGEDLPFGGDGKTAASHTFSMFRHVLDLETELDLFPEGWGPFDTMFMFTRWIFRYDCIYRRSCGLFDSADSYGGRHRDLVRMPKNLKPASVPAFEAGAVFPLSRRPGSLQPIREDLNPGFRYRTCDNAPDQRGNPSILLGALCNLNQRSRTPLDGPIDEFKGVQSKIVTRAGAFNRDLRSNLLTAARPDIGEPRFNELQELLVDGDFLGSGSLGVFRSLNAAAARARGAGDTDEAEELQAKAD